MSTTCVCAELLPAKQCFTCCSPLIRVRSSFLAERHSADDIIAFARGQPQPQPQLLSLVGSTGAATRLSDAFAQMMVMDVVSHCLQQHYDAASLQFGGTVIVPGVSRVSRCLCSCEQVGRC